jgi:hypothetical protein
MMATDRIARCNAFLSPWGPGYVTITVLFETRTGEVLGTAQYGVYPAHMEQVARDVAYWTCQFLNDAARAQGFIGQADAHHAHANAHAHVTRQLGDESVVRGRGCADFGVE